MTVEQLHRQSQGTSPWDILTVGSRISVCGRHGQIVARHYLFACVSYDDEPVDRSHWVPIGRCKELKPSETSRTARC